MAYSFSSPRRPIVGVAVAIAAGSATTGALAVVGVLFLMIVPLGSLVAWKWDVFGRLALVALGLSTIAAVLLLAGRRRDNDVSSDSERFGWKLLVFGAIAAAIPVGLQAALG